MSYPDPGPSAEFDGQAALLHAEEHAAGIQQAIELGDPSVGASDSQKLLPGKQ